ncbi:hypothetical protein Q427_27405 [Halomonas sp. BC04]|nr:hypothetical protein Q427_27405 [Halomonas sp. BC04]
MLGAIGRSGGMPGLALDMSYLRGWNNFQPSCQRHHLHRWVVVGEPLAAGGGHTKPSRVFALRLARALGKLRSMGIGGISDWHHISHRLPLCHDGSSRRPNRLVGTLEVGCEWVATLRPGGCRRWQGTRQNIAITRFLAPLHLYPELVPGAAFRAPEAARLPLLFRHPEIILPAIGGGPLEERGERLA